MIRRRTWIVVPVLAAALLLVLAASIRPGTPAMAQDTAGGRAESGDRLIAEGMTREELVSLYALLAGPSSEPPACVESDEMFDDVPASHPFCSWIEELARRGITQGCDDNNYCPGNPVTRGQMAPFIVRATPEKTVLPFVVQLAIDTHVILAENGPLTVAAICEDSGDATPQMWIGVASSVDGAYNEDDDGTFGPADGFVDINDPVEPGPGEYFNEIDEGVAIAEMDGTLYVVSSDGEIQGHGEDIFGQTCTINGVLNLYSGPAGLTDGAEPFPPTP